MPNGALKSQVLEAGVLRVCLHSGTEICISKMENRRYQARLGCDQGGNCVRLVAQSVPEWVTEIAVYRSGLLEPPGATWGSLEPFIFPAAIWMHLESPGAIWRFQKPFGTVCNHVDTLRAMWKLLGHLEPFGLLTFSRFWWLFQNSTFVNDRM